VIGRRVDGARHVLTTIGGSKRRLSGGDDSGIAHNGRLGWCARGTECGIEGGRRCRGRFPMLGEIPLDHGNVFLFPHPHVLHHGLAILCKTNGGVGRCCCRLGSLGVLSNNNNTTTSISCCGCGRIRFDRLGILCSIISISRARNVLAHHGSHCHAAFSVSIAAHHT